MIKFKKYNQFLTEAAESGKLKLIVISENKSEGKDTPDFLVARAKKKGMESHILVLDGGSIEAADNDSGDFICKNKDDETGFTINRDNTVIISRRGVVKNTHTRAMQSMLEQNGFFCINSMNSIEICENKFITAEKLVHAGIATPRTALVPSIDSIDEALKTIGGKFPIIAKTLSGTQGIGVSIIDSIESLKSVLQTMWKLSSGTEILIQEKIESDHDIRIHVLTKRFNHHRDDPDNTKIIGYMRRNRVDKDDFRTNHSLGGTVEKTELTDSQKDLAVRAAATMGCHWCGVDIITAKGSGKDYVLEVNASPGTKGIQKVTGETILDDLMDFVSNQDNWSSTGLEIGFREVIHVDGIGEFVAKFDSGNGSKSSTIHGTDITEKDGMVSWTLNGITHKQKIISYSNAEVGDKIHKRPIVELDIVFNGTKYSGMHFSVIDRTEKSTPMLINRINMERMDVIVNPQKTFIITYFNDSFKADTGKGKSNYGIKFLKKK
jgi:ribosomal protein S6--L-glutamate ligase